MVVCETCGKRVLEGRSGSFTQWVFRSGNCECANPVPVRRATAGGAIFDSRNFVGRQIELDDEPEDEAMLEEQRQRYGDRLPVSRYTVVSELGRGASGSVFLCRDRLLKKHVAIKCLNQPHGDLLVSFQNEAKATSQLSHPNIVKVIDFGVAEGGAPYMVLEHFAGTSLEALLYDQGVLDLDDATVIIAGICEALEYAHARRILHRDLKPSNVLVADTESGGTEVRLIDFGVAAFTQTSAVGGLNASKEKQGVTLVGTPSYMSPDQAKGIKYDERSEIYSVGCIYFELLTGRPPFSGSTPLEILNMHSTAAAPKLRRAMRSTSGMDENALVLAENVIDKCLAKKPEDRFQSVEELLRALRPLRGISDEPVELRLDESLIIPPVDALPLGKTSRTAELIVGTVVSLLVVGIVGGLLWFIVAGSVETPAEKELKSLAPLEDYKGESGGSYKIKLRGREWNVVLSGDEKHSIPLIKSLAPSEHLWVTVKVSDNVINTLRDLPLRGLGIDTGEFDGDQIDKIATKDDLEFLLLPNSNLKDNDVAKLAALNNLKGLLVSSPYITAKGVASLKTMGSLDELALSGMSQIDDSSVDDFLAIKNLKSLGLARTGITSSGIIRLLDRGHLEVLDMGGLSLEKSVYEKLRKSKLRMIGFSGAEKLTPEMMRCFVEMKQLRTIILMSSPFPSIQLQDSINQQRGERGLGAVKLHFGRNPISSDWDIMSAD